MATVSDIWTDTLQSVFKFLREQTYTRGGSAKTLLNHYNSPQLSIIIGFPDDITLLILPILALDDNEIPPLTPLAFDGYSEYIIPFTLYLFGGGSRTNSTEDTALNKLRQRQMMEDTKFILEGDNSIDNYITYYDFSDYTTPVDNGNDIQIKDVRMRRLPPTGNNEHERYRGVIEFNAIISITDNAS